METLKLNGFKPEREFWALSPQYFLGNNQWIGVEFSINSFQPKYTIRDVDSLEMFEFSALNVGYRKNISDAYGWGMNLSLASASYKWMNFRPLNFTYLNNGQRGSLGYSPELGLQFWYLHLNVGYNLAFKKSMRSYEKLYFTAKFDIPFLGFKSPEIGVQFWYLYLNAGCNLAFKKPMRNYEKFYFTTKFNIPFYRF